MGFLMGKGGLTERDEIINVLKSKLAYGIQQPVFNRDVLPFVRSKSDG
ncbi:MAG: hypothetical protein IGS48_23520 [Oscillatoriales cyanobacterium C42_A2020_001]|nr:hypothetical protein [Leptolyngbyaceae cyanobacterium C42_A2020_001]